MLGRQVEILSKGQPENVQILPPVLERGQHVAENLAILGIVRIDQHHSVCNRTAIGRSTLTTSEQIDFQNRPTIVPRLVIIGSRLRGGNVLKTYTSRNAISALYVRIKEKKGTVVAF